MRCVLAVSVVLAVLAGCGQAMTAQQVGQINDALHAYPDVAEAWVFVPADMSVYAEQRFGIGRPAWMMLHVEKRGVAGDPNAPTGTIDAD